MDASSAARQNADNQQSYTESDNESDNEAPVAEKDLEESICTVTLKGMFVEWALIRTKLPYPYKTWAF